MARDAAFLARCEAFLLHPAVRALSLAQRVDFLEQKGLTPEEITACLKRVELQHGLSALAAPVSAAVSVYARFRQRALEQQLLRRVVEQAQRRSRRSAKVANMLALLSDQQAQYAQSAAALERQIELEALKQELLGLKGVVVDAFVHPRAETAAAKQQL
ncbi:hypothetical protein PybrP1_006203 [[Pythium] brassicae (nom. inval.)]|nr:hypothetical protein PybrP1_006203 [[Pythium] brassicae (nom. inval.)]